MKKVYLYLPDGVAEWEFAYIMMGMGMESTMKNGAKEFMVYTVGKTKDNIISHDGLTLVPDITIEEMDDENAVALLLPGSDKWQTDDNSLILDKAEQYLKENKLVAAICGATLALADRGLLNDRLHTSNCLDYLLYCTRNYTGEKYFRQVNSCCDTNLITANIAGGLMWARDIMSMLHVYSDEAIEAWYMYYMSGNPDYYLRLMSYVGKC